MPVFVCALALAACGRCGADRGIVGRYDGGEVTVEELQREASRLPPILRSRFEGAAGRREMVNAIIDKRLLAAEARRRGMAELPDVRRQVEELEERLSIQALLAEEEKAAGAPGEVELRAWYDANRGYLLQPERVRVRRVLVAVSAGASRQELERARGRAEELLERLRRREPFEKVATAGDGPERSAGGDLGLLIRGEVGDAALEAASFGLQKAGDRTQVFRCADGFAVVELVERRSSRTPTFEEARADVANRIAPLRQRRVFDQLLARLRERADVKVEPVTLR